MKIQSTKDKGQRKGSRIQGIQDSRVRRSTPRILESLNPIRLFHDTGGQVLLLGIVVVVALLAFMLAIPNGTQAVTQKMRAQTAADAGAFTGSVWLARTLNLSTNMNIGIKSVYTWMTVLTVGSALAQALYSDTADSSVHALGQGMSSALFGISNPDTASNNQYPTAIQRLDETGQWLSDLQDDIAVVFPALAQTLGSEQARRNASGGNASSQNPGGMVLVRTDDTIPLLVTDSSGDSLVYADLLQLGTALDTIPTMDPNIMPATGIVIVSPTTWDIWAYYADTSLWMNRTDSLYHAFEKPIIQVFQHGSIIDSAVQYFESPGGGSYTAYLQGDSWATRVDVCNEESTHTPFIWPNGKPNLPYKNSAFWTLLNCHPGNNRYKLDTVWTTIHLAKRTDTSSMKNYYTPAESAWLAEHGDVRGSYYWTSTGFYTGVESTVGHKGAKVSPRRVNPDREFHAVAYVWRLGAGTNPRGLSPAVGGSLFPRSRVAATCPLLTVARSEPHMAASSPAAYEYYFTPAWDVRLTPLDSAGVQDICNDEAYDTLGLSTLDLEGLRRYVLLP